MDLEENIRIAAKEVWLELTSYTAFIRGAMSPEAKAYWYNEFKAEQVPIIQDEYSSFNKELVDQVLKVFGKRPHYPYGTVQSDPLSGATQKNFDDATPKYVWPEPVIMKGFEEYKEYMRDCPDPSFTFEDWKNMMTKYNQVTRKIVDEIAESVLGVSGHPIDIVLSEKWYRPNIFDNIDNDQQSIDIYKEHAKNGGIIIVGSDHPKILEAVIAMHKQGIVIKDTDDIVLKARSPGISAEPFVMHNMYVNECEYKEPPFVEKPWDTKKQKRNNYKKKKRK